MAGEWSRAGASMTPESLEPAIGDIWVDRRLVEREWPAGRAYITDVLPFTPKDAPPQPVARVVLEHVGGRREWLSVAELRQRFAFRSRGA